ncbi:MAG: ferritin-like domain-containing protein [Mycobacteriales bacterium]
MSTPTEALQLALAAEHATIWGYGVVGAQLSGREQPLARAADKAHRTRRDLLISALGSRVPSPPPTASSYELPFPVQDAASARRLAVHLEERLAAVWRAALAAVTDLPDRQLAVSALIDAATRGVQWRLAVPGATATVAFPGAS